MGQSTKETKPIVFISHRHKDRGIAKTITDYIRNATSGGVEVFCTSDERTTGLHVGKLISQELAHNLKACTVVLLIYTRDDDDWGYCMWECGVAFDPEHALENNESVVTNTVVLQFSSEPPAPLQALVRVDARSVESVMQFVRQFLTDNTFFPGLGKKITDFNEADDHVTQQGKKLYEDLAEYQTSWGPTHKLNVWPRMMLKIDFQSEEKVKKTPEIARETVLTEVYVHSSDSSASELFNVTSTEGRSLGDLFDEWKLANPDSDEKWSNSLVTQITQVLNARTVDTNWNLIHAKRKRGAFLPIVLSHLRLPQDKMVHLEVCFPEFYQTLEITNAAPTLEKPNTDYHRQSTTGTQDYQISPKIGRNFQDEVMGIRYLWINGDQFQMGCDEIEDDAHASPCHAVNISSFWLAETPVTKHQYQKYLDETGVKHPNYWMDNKFSEAKQPAVGISWDEAIDFCKWLANKTGLVLGLPTEAQWEFAARGTKGYKYPWGNSPPNKSLACYGGNERDDQPCPVGSFEEGKGPFGTLDQSGNVWEWCRDEWDERAYQKRVDKMMSDPFVNGISTKWRTLRGGAWDNSGKDTKFLMSAYRMANLKNIQHWAHGFRIAVFPNREL